jgi:hypothetical protein
MRLAAIFVTTLGWATYLGGVLVMEMVWRPLQADLPPAQTGVLCQQMGVRYRWLALSALLAAGAAWTTLQLTSSYALATRQWQTILGLSSLALLAALVIAMGAFVHPLSHQRSRSGSSPEERGELRSRRVRAIAIMNIMLRAELAIALLATLIVAWPAHTLTAGGIR